MTNGAEVDATTWKGINKKIYIWRDKERGREEAIYGFISVRTLTFSKSL
jgi:hypothetical protein